MPKRTRRESRTPGMLQDCFEAGLQLVEDQKLPGVDEILEKDEESRGWLEEQKDRVRRSIRDNDEIMFERALASYIRGWERLNELVAEEYRATNEDPELWELRYVRWMKIKFIRFESEKLGSFYVVPKRPKRKPRTEHWYTVEEMLDMLHPTTAAAINTFGVMPVRPDSLKGPEKGEKHLTCDFTEAQTVFAYTLPGGPKYDREKFCRRPDQNDSELPGSDDAQAV